MLPLSKLLQLLILLETNLAAMLLVVLVEVISEQEPAMPPQVVVIRRCLAARVLPILLPRKDLFLLSQRREPHQLIDPIKEEWVLGDAV